MNKVPHKLPHGCKCSELSVCPSNWKSTAAPMKRTWYISYRFYDPNFNSPKQVVIKGLAEFKQRNERQNAVATLLDDELRSLYSGYNPITKTTHPPAPQIEQDISPNSAFIGSLILAKKRIICAESMEVDLRTTIPYVEKAARHLKIENMRIGDIRRKHIRLLLDHIEDTSKCKSAYRYNRFRSNLMILFTELMEMDAIEFNPVRDIRKRKIIHKMRQVMDPGERTRVNEHLQKNYPTLHVFANIFFHSGARMIELINVKRSHVEIKNQRFKVLIKKGREYREVYKTIKDVALPYWEIALQGCSADDFVFGKTLRPGSSAVTRDWVTKLWQKVIKDDETGLGIKKDFYSLKHLNTDETAAMIGIEDAAAHDDHTTPVVTLKHYAVGEKERRHEKLKKVKNSFA